MEESKTYRIVKIHWLCGSDMYITVLIESTPENDPDIDRLVEVIEFLTDCEQSTSLITKENITTFFTNPLARELEVGRGGHSDHVGIYMLSGKFTFPSEITVPETTDASVHRQLEIAWEKSPLGCTKFPKWEKVCESVKRLGR